MIEWVLGAVGVAVVGWVVDKSLGGVFSKGYKHIFGPRLKVYYDEKQTYIPAFAEDVKRNGIFGHVMVKMAGNTDAKNCVGTLMSVEQKKNGAYVPHQGFKSPVQLKWAHEKDWSPKNIPPDLPIKLDLCYGLEGDTFVHFFAEKFPRGTQTDFPVGEYKVKVRVVGDNVKPAVNEFVVYWDGNWKNLRIGDYKKNT
jgi:hypothetical protein